MSPVGITRITRVEVGFVLPNRVLHNKDLFVGTRFGGYFYAWPMMLLAYAAHFTTSSGDRPVPA